MSLEGKKVLVTGAGGFIGSHLTERLVEEGCAVRAMVRYSSTGHRGWLETSPKVDEIDFRFGDIGDAESVDAAMDGVDVVFHLAALIGIPYSYEAPGSYVRTNITGTVNVLQSARRHGTARVLQTSTSEVYGTAIRAPIDEDHPLQGQSPYSATKIGSDKIAEAFYCSFNVPVVTVRPFNCYGPRQSTRAVIPTIISQCLRGGPIRLGNLTPTRDLNYVSNTVDGFLAAATAEEAVGRTINVGSGREISIGDLANLIAELSGSTARVELESIRLRPENSEVERLLADSRLAERLLGWTPKVSLEEGLERTIAWFRDNMDHYRIASYRV